MMTLSRLSIYPVKSCAGLRLDEAEVLPRGLAGDRRWMIVDADGRFVTGRKYPRITLIRAEPDGVAWRLQAPEHEVFELQPPATGAPRRQVIVWRSTVDALLAAPKAHAWISAVLGAPLQLVYMDEAAVRPADASYAKPGDEVSFADGFPLLLISEGSLAGLNARLAGPVTMDRFRPNLVVTANTPHIEDGWRRLRIGALEFDVVKPCSRCIFTTVDPITATFDAEGEPLRTLKTYRSTARGVMFGQNLISRGTGRLRVGDAVTPLD